MDNVLNFLADNYLYFMIGAVVLLFALIGFAVQGRKKKNEDINPMQPLNNPSPASPVSIQMPIDNNMPMMNNNLQQTPAPVVNNAPMMSNAPQPIPVPVANSIQSNTVVAPSPVASAPVSNNTEMLTFGPISADPNEALYTAAPDPNPSTNVEVGTLNLAPANNEPVMETLDLGAPQMQAAQEMPISMEPEPPIMPAAPAPAPVMEAQPPAPAAPVYSNTIQQ